MLYRTFRLDDIARRVVHYAPEVYFELLDPINPLGSVLWHDWKPGADDAWSLPYARTDIRRLDTQLAPIRWMPDLAYACMLFEMYELWASELQSVARRSPKSRASTCIAFLLAQGFPVLPLAEIVIRASELRMRRAPRYVDAEKVFETAAEGTQRRRRAG